MIILIDGPEKAGKSTLISELQRAMNAETVHWGKVPDDRVYYKPLMQAAESDKLYIWDRGWPSESVYGVLMCRRRRLAADPWIGEWEYGRIVQSRGLRVILCADVENLIARRTKDDLPVHPRDELRLFLAYAKKFGYIVLHNDYDDNSLRKNAETIMSAYQLPPMPPLSHWCGPAVKQVFAEYSDSPLPFSSLTEFARKIRKTHTYGWVNVKYLDFAWLENLEKIYAYGGAYDVLKSYRTVRRVL